MYLGLHAQACIDSICPYHREAQEREQQLHHQLEVISKQVSKANAALQEARQNRDNFLVSKFRRPARLVTPTILFVQNQGRALQHEISDLQRQKENLEDLSKEEAPQEVAVLEGVRADYMREKEEQMEAFQIVSFCPGFICLSSYRSIADLSKEARARW